MPYLVSYGPQETCTITTCDISRSVYQYRPSVPANAVFIVLFAIALVIHIVQGVRWRSWTFMTAMALGCVAEMIGYGGRIMLWQNPFTFNGFLLQIICITFAPVFFSAAIYITLAKAIVYLAPQHARFSPKLYYWLFIPCDLVSLALQATGGAMSSNSAGSNQVGVDIALVGLSFQVFTLTIFILLAVDYALRYRRMETHHAKANLPRSFQLFVAFMSLAVVCILVRCVYRIDELSDGYSGPLIHNEGLFIGLEGVMIVIATFSLNIAHPGPVFARPLTNSTGFRGQESISDDGRVTVVNERTEKV